MGQAHFKPVQHGDIIVLCRRAALLGEFRGPSDPAPARKRRRRMTAEERRKIDIFADRKIARHDSPWLASNLDGAEYLLLYRVTPDRRTRYGLVIRWDGTAHDEADDGLPLSKRRLYEGPDEMRAALKKLRGVPNVKNW